MKTGLLHIAVFLSVLFFSIPCVGKKNEGDVPFLETRVDRSHTVEGEKVIYEVVLITPDPSVAGVEVVSSPGFFGNDIGRSAPDSHLEEITLKGKLYYRAVIDRFFIGTGTKGKYTVKGGTYRVGINRQVAVNDPFWGPSVTTGVETFALSAPDLMIKVDPLPLKNCPETFSGAIGSYEIESALSSKELVAGEEALLLVTIAGKGDLSQSKLPEIHRSFGEGLHFKSMTDTMTHYIKDGSLGSEMEIECLFSADKPGKYIISPIEFSYFDSGTGKYVTIKSRPIEVEVIESARIGGKPPVIMDV